VRAEKSVLMALEEGEKVGVAQFNELLEALANAARHEKAMLPDAKVPTSPPGISASPPLHSHREPPIGSSSRCPTPHCCPPLGQPYNPPPTTPGL
jgi:hypothetical protein